MVPIETHTIQSSADISGCGKYRYSLSRVWDSSRPVGTFVLLNPSRAAALTSDQTMVNCNNLAVQWGWGGFYLVNLFAFRATDPKQLELQQDPVGPRNDREILSTVSRSAYVVLAWGNGHRKRTAEVHELLKKNNLHCIRKNAVGGYLHPARIKVEDYPHPIPV